MPVLKLMNVATSAAVQPHVDAEMGGCWLMTPHVKVG